MPYIGNAPYQGVIDSGNILNGTIDTVDIKDGAITNAKLLNSAITINGTSVSLGGSTTIAGGVTGSIQYNAGSTFGGVSTFVYDSANGWMGIGTASPTEELTVAGQGIFYTDTINTHSYSLTNGGTAYGGANVPHITIGSTNGSYAHLLIKGGATAADGSNVPIIGMAVRNSAGNYTLGAQIGILTNSAGSTAGSENHGLFFGTQNGGTAVAIRAYFEPAGNFVPNNNVTYTLGTINLRWLQTYTRDIFASKYNRIIQSITSSAGTQTIDFNSGSSVVLTLNAGITGWTLQNIPSSVEFEFRLYIVIAAGGSISTWPTGVKWANGQTPSLSTTASKIDVISFVTYDGGSSWLAMVVGQNF
ncbi:MAG: hypothetical protein EBT26_05315 [Microbacteriaceae bacterium]|nr:hypothetical protein [Microbacteriaceae bacterium]NBS61445.1 hypothetical protein [Microbacteriaceae bacterium]